MNRIGRYKILKRLGGGGFGEVFLGEDQTIGRQVAIKVFKPKDENLIAFATSSDEEGLEILRARFLNEARILASLDDEPNVVAVLDYGELEDGAPYYVMPYLPRSLSEELGKDVFDVNALEELPQDQRPRAFPMDRALEILEQILTGLSAAHVNGLVHRDIKPSNLMLSESGQIRVVDFGIAKAPDGQHSTVSHLGLGSRNYMAPEQRESAKHVDARADVYSAGVVAYRMLTGKLPVGRFADPNVAVPALGKPLNDLLLAMVSLEKNDRPADAAEALGRFEEARESVGEDDPEATGTWVGQGEAAVRDELKPLRAKIAEVVGEHGEIRDKDRPGVLALASIADLDDGDLDRLIEDIIHSDKALADKQKLVRALRRQVRIKDGSLDEDELASYDTAAEAVGWDRDKIEQLMRHAVAALETGHQPATKSSAAGRSRAGSGAGTFPLKPVGIAVVLLLVVLAAGWGVVEWRQHQIVAEQAERERAAQAAAEQQAWAEAQSVDAIERYETYLDNWPDGLNRAAAEQRIAALEAQGQSMVARIQDYLNRLDYRVPESGELETRTVESIKAFEEAQGLVVTGNADDVLLEALQVEWRERDEASWSQATEADTESAYLSYREAFPDGSQTAQVDDRIARVKERIAWEQAAEANTIGAFEGYREAYPQGRYTTQAEARIQGVRDDAAARAAAAARARDESAWEQARGSDTIAAYQGYLNNFPQGIHIDDAAQGIAAIHERDDAAWAHAQAEGDIEDYQHYLRAWPQGRHVEEAETKIARRTELIRAVQAELVRLGRDVETDGDLDAATARAIEVFQGWTDRERTARPSADLLATLEQSEEWPVPEPGETFRDCPDCPEMVVVPSGTFQMGSPAGEQDRQDDEGPRHRVSLPLFALAKTEVTVGEFRRFVDATGHRTDAERNAGGNDGCFAYKGGIEFGWTAGTSWRDPGYSQSDSHPVVCVSWNDARAYVRWLSDETGQDYRLPSEAEQEYALRAGSTTPYPWGRSADEACRHANVLDRTATARTFSDFSDYAVACSDDAVFTAPVGSYTVNGFGVSDTSGNVWEWGRDCWNDSYRGAPDDGSAWMSGDCGRAVLRGGSWNGGGAGLRSAGRLWYSRDHRFSYAGFRPAKSF